MLKASDIMKRKGIVQKQMDMNKFNEVIENFFMTHEPKETILLTPKRFIEMDNPPEGDFIDYLDVSVWEKRSEDPDDPFDFIDYQFMKKNGMLRPILMVNEPFIGNAAGWLRDLWIHCEEQNTKEEEGIHRVSAGVKPNKAWNIIVSRS